MQEYVFGNDRGTNESQQRTSKKFRTMNANDLSGDQKQLVCIVLYPFIKLSVKSKIFYGTLERFFESPNT